jgi:hypothetical protein
MNLKGTGFVPVIAIFCFFSLALGLKLEVEIVTPITKARTLPSASSDPRGFVRKGQTFIVDGESGEWYRVSIYNSFVWIPKDAVKILRKEEEPPAVPAAAPSAAPTTVAASPSAGTTPAERNTPGTPSSPKIGQTVTIAQKNAAAETTATPVTTAPAAAVPAAKNEPPRALPNPAHPMAAARPPQVPPPPKPAESHTWFSKRSLVSRDADGKEILYFQVSNKAVPVFAARTNAAVTLAQAKKGDYFQLLEQDGLWCRIAVNDTSGWVELTGGAIVSAPKSGIDEFILILLIAAIIVVATLFLIILLIIRGRGRKKTKTTVRFHGLIIARSVPEVKGAISGKSVPLEKHLASNGFSVKTVRKLGKAQKIIDRQHFEVVFIDWYISDDIPGTVEILFTTLEQKNLPLAIFYNVPKTTESPLIPVLLRSYYLGVSITDRDISNLLTPTMLSSAEGAKAGAASALEGDIAEGNLPEIMEFIEIGKKTGALAIETDSPLGVLYFVEGRVVHAAAANGIFGRDAINTLLNLKQGRFRFLLDKLPKVRDLNLSTLEVLMEWTKTEDEAHKH